jgi:Tetratricopeptide repeat
MADDLKLDDVKRLTQRNQRNLESLVRSVQMSLGKLNLLIAVCDHPGYRDAVIDAYEESLSDLTDRKVVCCRGTIDRSVPNLSQTLADLYAQQPKPLSPTVVTIVGPDEVLGIRIGDGPSPLEQLFFSAQWSKSGLVTFGVPIVLWVSSDGAKGLAREAPDFWSGRGGVFQFERPLEPGESAGVQQDLLWAIDACESAIRYQQPSESLEFARSLAELAGLYEAIDRFEMALPLWERVFQIYRQSWGDDHPDTRTALTSLAALYELTERYPLALPLYERVLIQCETEYETTGDVLAIATSLNQLAYLHRLMGAYELALPLYERALALRRSASEPEAIATSLNNLAGLRLAMGDYALAFPLYEEAVALFESVLGRSHSSTIVVRGNLEALRERMGN